MEILGVDIGGTGIKGAIVDTETGELITQRIRLLTPQPATPEAVASVLKELVVQTGFKGPVACGFPARITNGTVKTAANIDKSWIDVPVEELFTRELTCDTKVSVVNDADAAGLAELEFGAALQYALGTVIAVKAEALIKKAVGVVKIRKAFIRTFVGSNVKIAYFYA